MIPLFDIILRVFHYYNDRGSAASASMVVKAMCENALWSNNAVKIILHIVPPNPDDIKRSWWLQ